MKGFIGARFKKFDTDEQAQMFVRGETVKTDDKKGFVGYTLLTSIPHLHLYTHIRS